MDQEGVEGEEGEGGWQAAGPTPPPAALRTKPRMMQSWPGAAGGLEETWASRVGGRGQQGRHQGPVDA